MRLQLIFEYENELVQFFRKDRFTKSSKCTQAISKKYQELFHPTIQDIMVLFYAFEPLAKEDSNIKIPQKIITSVKENHKDLLWEIARFGQHVTFFFYTNSQLKKAQKTGLTNILK